MWANTQWVRTDTSLIRWQVASSWVSPLEWHPGRSHSWETSIPAAKKAETVIEHRKKPLANHFDLLKQLLIEPRKILELNVVFELRNRNWNLGSNQGMKCDCSSRDRPSDKAAPDPCSGRTSAWTQDSCSTMEFFRQTCTRSYDTKFRPQTTRTGISASEPCNAELQFHWIIESNFSSYSCGDLRNAQWISETK